MTKKDPSRAPLIAVAAFVIVAALGSVIWLLAGMLRGADARRVEIVQSGNVLYTYDLATAAPQTVRIEAPDGGWNEFTIADGEIRMTAADCPDQTCVHMGPLRAENLPIVCLPHQLVIRFEDAAT